MHPALPAKTVPDQPAIIMSSGEQITFMDLDRRSNQIAHLLRGLGLKRGDSIAILARNSIEYLLICAAATRTGLYFTPIATGLKGEGAAYIVKDCGAKVLFADLRHAETAQSIITRVPKLSQAYSMFGPMDGFKDFETEVSKQQTSPVDDESLGQHLLYSSGTTGRPKGIKTPLPERAIDGDDGEAETYFALFGLNGQAVYLSPAPLYHAAPLRFALTILSIGATIVVMEKFEPELALSLIEKHRVTHSQWVPTMFVKLLQLPDETRFKYDLSSHQVAIHGAAPCPPDAKIKMIEWWGPVLFEYYGGSEGIGSCAITSEEWIEHPGSVGQAKIGKLMILDENGDELGPNETGFVYFSGGPSFEYLNRDEDTKAAMSKHGAQTFGDVGHVDEEGYLYLTDRASNLIISGGVNVYPQETEDLLLSHPEVADAAVFGVPNPDFGEEVKAVVQPVDWSRAGEEFETELIAYCQSKLAKVKCPRSVDFEQKLPREENGKLYKRLLKDKYWSGRQSQLI